MTINRSKSNKIKRNKTKRRRQTKNKRRRQTKNKRRRQHGGTKYQYNPDSQTILNPVSVPNPVLIPGYSEIIDTMQEYEDPRDSNNRFIIQSKKIKEGIKEKEVHLLTDCSLQTQIDENKIIVLRKEDKKIPFFKLNNSAIKCTPEQYYAFASHNFRIFIEDILKWNPFLNLPFPRDKKVQHPGSQSYHLYVSKDTIFKKDEWWNQQEWWTKYKEFDYFKEQVLAAATAAEEATAATAAREAREAAAAQIRNEQTSVEQQRARSRLLHEGLYYPHPYATTTQ